MKFNDILLFIVISMVILGIISNMYIKKTKQQKNYEKSVKILYRQAARWGAAALQDESEMIALLHANYAAGYLWSIKDIITTERFKEITGVNFMEFEQRIVQIQDTATKRMIEKCPDLVFLKDKILLAAMYSRNN